MFVSKYNTYITIKNNELSHNFLCDYYEDDAPHIADDEYFRSRHYTIEPIGHGCVALKHNELGYVSLQSDLGVTHVWHIGEYEAFRKIDPSILPEPVPEFPQAEHIARNIHQIGIYADHPGEYPKMFIENRNHIINLNQSFNFYFWSEGGFYDIEEFIQSKYGKEVLKYYRSIKPAYAAARSDLFRYLCLYAMGGVYIDLKSTISYPLDKILRPTDRFLVSFWHHNDRCHPELNYIPYGGEYEQYYLVCAAGHPLMRRIIQQVLCNITIYDEKISGIAQYGTLRLTGPVIFSKLVHEYRKTHEDMVRQIHSVSNGISYSIFNNYAKHKVFSSKGKHYSDNKTSIVDKTHLV